MLRRRLSPSAQREATRAGGERGIRLSLRTKGFIAFGVVLVYVLLIGVLLAHLRDELRVTVEQQSSVFAQEEALARVNTALAYATLNVNDAHSTPNPRVRAENVALDIEAVQAGLQGLKHTHPAMQGWLPRLEASVSLLRADWGTASLLELRESLHELVSELDAVTVDVRKRRKELYDAFRTVYNNITLATLVSGAIGVITVGSAIALFFSRLVVDIRKLQARALNVVTGYRGVPIEVTRRDELGALMQSVNQMQSELREREDQLEVARQQRFHQEKMAAIGSLAAAIAHEVNNPIAAITGVAEAINETRRSAACPNMGEQCRPELILEQTRRIGQITRQLAEMTRPYSPDAQLIDLNELVRNTCAFITYDRRFRDVELTLDLDSQLPAVKAVADHVTQVLMNLLINAADATLEAAGRKPTVTIQTQSMEGGVLLVVSDNGCGMAPSILARAFDQGFTTKPQGDGCGLGLFMCRSLITAEGGRIDLDSESGRGTRACVYLPCLSHS